MCYILATLALTAYTPHYCCNLYYKSYGTNICSNVTDEVFCEIFNMRVQLAGLYLNNYRCMIRRVVSAMGRAPISNV